MKPAPFRYALRIWLASVAISPLIFIITIFDRMPGSLPLNFLLMVLLLAVSMLFGLPSLFAFGWLVYRKSDTGGEEGRWKQYCMRSAAIVLVLNFLLLWAILRSDVMADATFYLRLIGVYLITTMFCIRYMRY
ncbi:hypothetical protein [Chitinophaga deserti]|uniref:hypothetical protein n=1 Tax=Chitinophaga deserti TaxID=2164099 RepID=UPI000D6D4337|nr:hypothetical protein [Chitinophaga deserti]